MNKPAAPASSSLTVKHTESEPWVETMIPEIQSRIFVKPLHDDADTGMTVSITRYPAGHTTSWHTHPCAHGIYVMEGLLKTHAGDFPAGSWIWFPEGELMQHGAPADADVTFMFITNKPFGITFAHGT